MEELVCINITYLVPGFVEQDCATFTAARKVPAYLKGPGEKRTAVSGFFEQLNLFLAIIHAAEAGFVLWLCSQETGIYGFTSNT